jgi:probable F420-dependent oxidoreductase
MRYGFYLPTRGPTATRDGILALAREGERLGLHSAMIADHIVFPVESRSPYPYTVDGKHPSVGDALETFSILGVVAGATERLRLVTSVLVLPYRNPVLTAKMVASLDVLSGGRLILGVGAGWLQEEFAALGVPFAERGARMDEYIAAMRELWSADKPTFKGRFVTFEGAYCRPQPVNKSVPIIVGGHSEAAARRAGRLGDGFFPARGAPAQLIAIARKSAEEAGRDPDKLEITASLPDDLAELDALRRLGVTRVLVPSAGGAGLQARIRGPEDLADWAQIIERYRAL